MEMSLDFKYNYPQIARDSGFKLRQFRDGPLDWRIVASLEIERILREQQFEHIDAILFYLSEAPLVSMLESNILDSGIAKYFILSQLAIQYLMFCRKFLDETVRTLRESLANTESENIKLKTVNQEHSNEILQLHKKISQIEVINDIVFPCHECTKNFVSNDALNIHLNKKHSKIQTGDIQGKDNDRTLISTIKLELEIKHLKERLNNAEKDIRETVESKKGSPRDVTKVCSSTQITTATIDIGTQSNLAESKESDCTDNVKDPKFEILFQIQEKISNLESWQEIQRTGNQQSINEITRKLSEITKSLQCKAVQDAENLNIVAQDAISSSVSSKQHLAITSTDELQTILSNTFNNVLHLNSSKLNEILTKIEAICEEKFPSLEVQIQRERKIAQQSIKTALSLPVSEIASPSKNDEQSFPRAHATQNPDRLLARQAIKTALPITASSSASSSNNEDLLFEGKECSTPYSKGTYSIDQLPPIIGFPKGIESDDNETDVSQEILYSEEDESENVPFEDIKAAPKDSTIFKRLIKSVDKEMASYGINSNIKAISASETAKVTSHLADKRSSLKKIYPQFYATRNKLKKIVEVLSSNKQIDGQLHSLPLMEIPKLVQNLNIDMLSKVRSRSNFPLNYSKDEYKINNAFKKGLEKILSSPIKKPRAYVTNKLAKPIPLPRKRVMFYNADQVNAVDEVSLPAPRSKTTI